MTKFSTLLALAAAAYAMGPAGAALASKTYTVNTEPLALRASPSDRGKTLAMLPPSSTVERVNDRAYARVIYRTPDGKEKEGWFPARFLSAVPADSSPFKDLSAQNEALKARVDQLQNDDSGLSQKEKDLTEKLTTLNAAYEELKSGSANYVKLKAEYDSAKEGLDSARKVMQALAAENENLKLSHNVQMFLAGGLVLLFGWVTGWISTKLRTKKRQKYYL